MKRVGAICLLATLLATIAGVAQAQWAYTNTSVHLRAGPAPDYPAVAILPPRFHVMVHGCLHDYSWCDVSAGLERGWVYAAYIYHPYRGSDVPIIQYGALIGLAVLGFFLHDYWADHYHHRPFYHERERWQRRPPPPPHAAPRIQRPPPPHQRFPPEQRSLPPPKSAPRVPGAPLHEPPGTRSHLPPQRAPDMDRRQPPQHSSPGDRRSSPSEGGR